MNELDNINLLKQVAVGDDQSDSNEEEDLDKGLLRTVKGANLVSKTRTIDNTYDELWIYKITADTAKNKKIYSEILAGSDVPVTGRQTEDGSQTVETWSVGNVNFVKITGLPN